jgi:hypothetical protein
MEAGEQKLGARDDVQNPETIVCPDLTVDLASAQY